MTLLAYTPEAGVTTARRQRLMRDMHGLRAGGAITVSVITLSPRLRRPSVSFIPHILLIFIELIYSFHNFVCDISTKCVDDGDEEFVHCNLLLHGIVEGLVSIYMAQIGI